MSRLSAWLGAYLYWVEFCFGLSRTLAVWRIRLLCASGHFFDALQYGAERLVTFPDSALLHYYSGRASIGLVRLDYARVRMAYAVALNPKEPRFHFGLGYCAQRCGELEVASREYEEVLDRTPDDLNARLNLALVYKSQSEHVRAIHGFKTVIASRPKDTKALFGTALSSYALGRSQDAKNWAKACLVADRRHGKSHALLGKIYVSEGQTEPALEHMEHAHEEDPDNGAVLAAMGRIYMESNPAHARHLLREALLVARPDTSAHFELGQYYEHCGKLREAAGEYDLYSRTHTGRRADWSISRKARLHEKIREREMNHHD